MFDRDFLAEAPHRKWVTDITYLWTAQGWVYLAVVVDLFSRKVVGWSLSDSLATDLVAAALRQAIEARRPVGSRLLHHSDRGCQYTSDTSRAILRAMNIECSMSRTGSCYDNAVAERFFWSLKHEWTNHAVLADLDAATRLLRCETPPHSPEVVGYRNLRIEVQDVGGKPLPGFGSCDGTAIGGDGVKQRVEWKGNPSLSRLNGSAVRLRFVMSECDLYSFQFCVE